MENEVIQLVIAVAYHLFYFPHWLRSVFWQDKRMRMFWRLHTAFSHAIILQGPGSFVTHWVHFHVPQSHSTGDEHAKQHCHFIFYNRFYNRISMVRTCAPAGGGLPAL
jgi:hypothetical protein